MHVARPFRVSVRQTASERVGQAFRRLRGLVGQVRASEYVTVGSSARYRAHQRRATRTASRVGFLLIAGAALFDGFVVFDPHLKGSLVLVGLNGAVAIMALAGWATLNGALRRYPEAAAFVITLAMAVATAGTGIVIPGLAVESVGYLLVFPGLIALILPWQTRTHLEWLLAYAVVAVGFLMYETPGGPSTDERGDLIVVAAISLVASLAGHVLLQRAQIRNFSHVQKIQALRRRAAADMQELARVHAALATTARTDQLTGAFNRVRLVEDLRVVRSRLDRAGTAYGLIAFDLDRFKLINDTYGHLAGDDVLRRVAAAARRTLRPTDGLYRSGGEEFLVILEASSEATVRAAAERIRSAVMALDIPHAGNVPYGVVTASLGFVLIRPADLPQSDDEWLAHADAALYRAKAAGRNRVESAAS